VTRLLETDGIADRLDRGSAKAVTDLDRLAEIARRVRVHVIRTVARAGGGHIGGSLSAADLLVALYFRELNIRPEDPAWEGRDRFVLSKGHAALGLYATLALRGYFPLSELDSFGHLDSRFQGHPDMTRLSALDMSTGALGVGFSAAVGIAMGSRLRGTAETTWVMLGDGECQEGEVWEAAAIAGRYALDNLIAIVDFNQLQVIGWPGRTAGSRAAPWKLSALARQWSANGWIVQHTDGHDFAAILEAFAAARRRAGHGRPVVILAKTVKGRGVSFMNGWHSRVPTPDEFRRAMEELGEDV
jgi:transketolase